LKRLQNGEFPLPNTGELLERFVAAEAALDEIDDEKTRAYIETAIHSDIATEPHLTSALNGLKNVLMEDPR
jgi:hypothetical protein